MTRKPIVRASLLGACLLAATASALLPPTSTVRAQPAPASRPADPVPHHVITTPYVVCQDLEELTSRINNLYRRPIAKLYKNGVAQTETVIFKDIVTGAEVAGITRELAADISHSDLKRPVWTVDGSQILFMGNRGFFKHDGSLIKRDWMGWKFQMNADYTGQRALVVTFRDEAGKVVKTDTGIEGKFNTLDVRDGRFAYYAINETLYRLTLGKPGEPNYADPVLTFATPHRKIIQDSSTDGKLLIQDVNAEFVEKEKRADYKPHLHLVDLTKKKGEPGFYSHHPFDYALPDIKNPAGRILHAATNNNQFHSLLFLNDNTIGWNYGSMVAEGEFLGWSLDITNGLDGTPKHGDVSGERGTNRWKQYESHGDKLGDGKRVYFSGPVVLPDGKKQGEWGLYLADSNQDDQPPRYLMKSSGGHAVGRTHARDVFAAHIQNRPDWGVKESDGIVFGDADGNVKLLCYTFSQIRGGIRMDRTTKTLRWSGIDNNDYRPYHAIPRPLISPDGTKVWFHSSMLMPLEEWCGIYVATARRPAPPTDLRAGDAPAAVGTITLAWTPAKASAETRGYRVYRLTDPKEGYVELTTAPIRETTFVDPAPVVGKPATYAVTAEEWSTLESDRTSNTLTVGPTAPTPATGPSATKFDTTTPAPPASLTAAREPAADGQYRLTWAASPSKDVRHYNVYFSSTGKPDVSQKRLIVSPPAGSTAYLDWSAPEGTDAYYAITAIDRQGNESKPVYAEVKR